MKVRTKGYRGNIVKGATVVSNDPKTPKRFLRISAQVKPLIECSPTPYINVSKKYGQEIMRTLAIWSPVDPNFKVEKVESFAKGVVAEIIKSWKDKNGMHYNIKVTFSPKMRIGAYHGFIRLFTNLKKVPVYDLRISGMVQGPVMIMPTRSSMFSDPAIVDGMAATGFNLYASEEGLKIKKITSTLKGLVTKLIPVVEGKKYYIIAVWPGGTPPSNPYSGKLMVYTNSTAQPVIEIPLSIYARRVVKPVGGKKHKVIEPPPGNVPPPGSAPPGVNKGE